MRWPLLYAISLLTACAAAPAVRTVPVPVRVPVYVPLDPRLTEVVPKPVAPEGPLTNADLFRLAIERGFALDTANAKLRAIRKLQPTGDTHEP